MRSEYERVKQARIKRKEILVNILGGKCIKCGYNKCVRALDFHHIDPKEKDFSISQKWNTIIKCLEEIKKCILLCSNCHRELHYGIWNINYIDLENYFKIINIKIDDVINNLDKPIIYEKICCNCKKEFTTDKSTKRNCSEKCRSQHRRKYKNRPNLNTLLKEVNIYGYRGTGKKYGVSDNAIKKWIKNYGGIPPRKHKNKLAG